MMAEDFVSLSNWIKNIDNPDGSSDDYIPVEKAEEFIRQLKAKMVLWEIANGIKLIPIYKEIDKLTGNLGGQDEN